MPCCSCRDKLALRLVRNHKIDLIRALEIADKGMERHEKSKEIRTVIKEKSVKALEVDPDYSQVCASSKTMSCPNAGVSCVEHAGCLEGTCPSGCPAPKAHSHLVSDGCVSTITVTCVFCLLALPRKCRATGTCTYTGNCDYDCDDGYTYNPVTGDCELIAVAHQVQGDGLTFVIT